MNVIREYSLKIGNTIISILTSLLTRNNCRSAAALEAFQSAEKARKLAGRLIEPRNKVL